MVRGRVGHSGRLERRAIHGPLLLLRWSRSLAWKAMRHVLSWGMTCGPVRPRRCPWDAVGLRHIAWERNAACTVGKRTCLLRGRRADTIGLGASMIWRPYAVGAISKACWLWLLSLLLSISLLGILDLCLML